MGHTKDITNSDWIFEIGCKTCNPQKLLFYAVLWMVLEITFPPFKIITVFNSVLSKPHLCNSLGDNTFSA
jgi:hypothetical protein